MPRGQVTVYIDKDWYIRLQKLVAPKPSSRELDELIKNRVLEIEGEGVELENTIDYEGAKKDHLELVKKIDRFQSLLRKHDAYDRLEDLAYECGLEWDGKVMDNLEEVSTGVLNRWDGPPEDAHIFLSFLEAIKKKTEIERQLEMVRLK